MCQPMRCLLMGAAGRDYRDFLIFFHDRPDCRVCAFTASQIPFIESRRLPRDLAAPYYDGNIPHFPESELTEADLVRVRNRSQQVAGAPLVTLSEHSRYDSQQRSSGSGVVIQGHRMPASATDGIAPRA